MQSGRQTTYRRGPSSRRTVGGVHRRWWGLSLLLLVVLAAAVAPRLSDRRIPGTAMAIAAAPLPIAGDCLVEDLRTVPRVDVRGADGLAHPAMGPCTIAHFGEMVAVLDDGSLFPRAAVNTLSTPDVGYCYQAAEAYLGLHEQPTNSAPGQRDVGFSVWYPTQRGQIKLIGPDPRGQQLGEHWIGCGIYAAAGSYVGSVQNAFLGGRMPNAFALCRNDIGETATIPCDQGHRVELFGTASLTAYEFDVEDLSRSCLHLVTTVTRMTDPTAGGRLTVTADVFHSDSSGTRHPGAPGIGDQVATAAVCSLAVKGTGFLTGSLFGWGDRPIPLSG